MKILWLVNVPIPEASKIYGIKSLNLGGWLINTAELLSEKKEIELYIIFPFKKSLKKSFFQGNRIKFQSFYPINDLDKERIDFNSEFADILKFVQPDLIHIHGTELAHSLSMVNTCNNLGYKFLISIQGLVSIISKHTYAHLPMRVIYGLSFRNLLLGDNVYKNKQLYTIRGKSEKLSIERSENIIGRTTWDKACIKQINKNITYYHCNEILRKEFYSKKWLINECDRFSIFSIQSEQSFKGLHLLLEAISILKKDFQNVKLYIGGKFLLSNSTVKNYLQLTHYQKYIKHLIIKNNLSNHIIFLGSLNAEQIVKQILKSHVYVCSSTIENSPNSLGEAMLLGIPSVASFVGGIPDFITHGVNGYLYASDAPYMLAHNISEIFNDDNKAIEFSEKSREKAKVIFDEKRNIDNLLNIYSNVATTK